MITKEGQKAIVLKVELDTTIQEMFFTEEMVENIGSVITISKQVEYLDDFYTIEGDDNYNAYHISWLHIITQPTTLDSDVEEILLKFDDCIGVENYGVRGYRTGNGRTIDDVAKDIVEIREFIAKQVSHQSTLDKVRKWTISELGSNDISTMVPTNKELNKPYCDKLRELQQLLKEETK